MKVDKLYILREIKRLARVNGERPPGKTLFQKETGVREYDWNRYWTRWGDALHEAGYEANAMNPAMSDEKVQAILATIVRELGRLPTRAELRLRRSSDSTVPSPGVFDRIASRKRERALRLKKFCQENPEFADVIPICEREAESAPNTPEQPDRPLVIGEVYLIKSGKDYKIGRSVSAERRTRELQIQLPQKARRIHTIKTDDPAGIERYWHGRFADKRGNGEWFRLTPADVSAFRRRKFM